MVNQWLKLAQNIIVPRRCVLCADQGIGEMDLCQGCHADLPWIEHACVHCGSAVRSANALCSQCQQHPPRFDLCLAPLRYQYPVDFLIQQFKFHHHLVYGHLLTVILESFIRKQRHLPPPDCIAAVPLHPSRLRERGFNQSHIMARHLAKRLAIPYVNDMLVRQRATQTQSQLDARQRHRNVRQAFQVTQDVSERHIVLIDDVVTTGATVNEISQLLKKQGAAHVEVWCIARA